ncbi:MAG: hypothetical protein IJV35_05140 [Neisseriaceae bacterium]|nr:hypothetical protein [Neisseriaceae bacterium]
MTSPVVQPLSLQGDYAQEVLSYYLWGQKEAPAADKIVDEQYIDRPTDITMDTILVENKNKDKEPLKVAVKLQVNAQEYMNKIGNNIQLERIGVLQKFFNNVKNQDLNWETIKLSDIQEAGGVLSPDGKTISLSHKQFVDMAYDENKSEHKTAMDAEWPSYQYHTDIGNNDYWQRAFVFGSTKLKLDTDSIRYVFDAETGQALRVENIKVKPMDDNFDWGCIRLAQKIAKFHTIFARF